MMRLIISLLMTVFSLSASAQKIGELFVDMPDSIVTYIDRNARENLVKFADVTKDTVSSVNNAMGGTSYIVHLSDDHLSLKASKVLTVEMSLLSSETDTLICLLVTHDAGECESHAYIYNKVWEKKNSLDLESLLGMEQITKGGNADGVETLLPEMKMIHATFLRDNPQTLSLCCSYPLVSSEEKEKENAQKVVKMLKWDGQMFK